MSQDAMLCPVDRTPLTMSDRQGIEIDFCPQCRGVWLDRGELDKIVERSVGPMPRGRDRDDDRGRHQAVRHFDDDDDYRGYGRGRRKKSFLSELFD